MIKVQSNPVPD